MFVNWLGKGGKCDVPPHPGLQVGARVALQRSPILRLAQEKCTLMKLCWHLTRQNLVRIFLLDNGSVLIDDWLVEAERGGWLAGRRIAWLRVAGWVELGCILQCSNDAEWTKSVRIGV